MDAKKVKSGSRDTINSFPDEILAKILSFLPTKRAASTSLVSKRWRNLFPLMFQLFESQHHLYLDDSDLLYPEEGKRERKDVEESFWDFADKTLSRCSSIKKLSLKCPRSTSIENYKSLHHALERGVVVDLDLRIPRGFIRRQIGWPRGVFTTKTLVKLTIDIERGPKRLLYCFIPHVFLPALKSLFLRSATCTCESFCELILLGCPILEELSLQHLPNPPGEGRSMSFSIAHKTLKRLTSHYGNSLHHCRIMRFYLPSLVYLEYSGLAPCSTSTANFLDSLVEAKLEVFLDSHLQHDVYVRELYGYLTDLSTIMNWMCNVKTLTLSSATVKAIYSRCVGLPLFLNLVTLHFESTTKQGWEVLRPLLNKSPKLETLVLKGLHCVTSQGVCIDRNEVKVLEIYGFRGRGREVRQVKCFLRKMQSLQVMKVEIDDVEDNKKLRLINHILALPRLSSKLQILFL